jgi:hypothetical protein
VPKRGRSRAGLVTQPSSGLAGDRGRPVRSWHRRFGPGTKPDVGTKLATDPDGAHPGCYRRFGPGTRQNVGTKLATDP